MEQETGKRQVVCESLLNAADIAALLRISKRFAYQLMANGVIPSIRIGRAVRVREADMAAYLVTLERPGS